MLDNIRRFPLNGCLYVFFDQRSPFEHHHARMPRSWASSGLLTYSQLYPSRPDGPGRPDHRIPDPYEPVLPLAPGFVLGTETRPQARGVNGEWRRPPPPPHFAATFTLSYRMAPVAAARPVPG